MKPFWALALSASLVLAPMAQASPPTAGTQHTIVRDGALTIEVLSWGRSGPDIVMIPAMGRGAEDFDATAHQLVARGFRVLAPQPRLVGRSNSPTTPITMDDYARDLITAIEAKAHGRVILVGHAYGAFVGRQVALSRPDLVRGLVIAGAGTQVHARPSLDQVGALSDPAVSAARRRALLQEIMFPPKGDITPWVSGWHRAAHVAQLAAVTRGGRAIGDPTATPVLDLQGELDAFRPRVSVNELRERMGPNVSIVVLPGLGHALFPEDPAAVAAAISDWAHGLPRR